MDIHKRENLDIAFRFLSTVEKIPLVNIGKYLQDIIPMLSLPEWILFFCDHVPLGRKMEVKEISKYMLLLLKSVSCRGSQHLRTS